MSSSGAHDNPLTNTALDLVKPGLSNVSSLELAAIELYAQILLSRAHFLLFNAVRADVAAEEDVFHQGKAALEEAEALCMSGEYSVNHALVAHCWYIRGFLADVGGDEENAVTCFLRATRMDEKYKIYKRVQWHLHRQEDAAETAEMWDTHGSDIGGWKDKGSRKFEDTRDKPPSSLFEMPEHPRDSVLWDLLMKDLQENPGEVSKQTSGSDASASAHVDLDGILNTLRIAPARSHQSYGKNEDSDHQRSRLRNHSVPSLLESPAEHAKKEQQDRDHAVQRVQQSALSARTRRPSKELALLSDTPGIAELKARLTPESLEKRLQHPPVLSLVTQTTRRQSVTNLPSPALPSPLRMVSLIDEDEDEGKPSVKAD